MKISENQKVTLTLGQLKRLVKESLNEGPENNFSDEVQEMVDFRNEYDKFIESISGKIKDLQVKLDNLGGIRMRLKPANMSDEEKKVALDWLNWQSKEFPFNKITNGIDKLQD